MTHSDFSPAANQGARPLVDLGCGSGYWPPGYADEAAAVIGAEPDLALLPLAEARDPRVRVLSSRTCSGAAGNSAQGQADRDVLVSPGVMRQVLCTTAGWL